MSHTLAQKLEICRTNSQIVLYVPHKVAWGIDLTRTCFLSALIAAVVMLAVIPAFAQPTPSDVYARVTQINDRLATVLEKNQGEQALEQLSMLPTDGEIFPRHVFQRALDVEQQLIALLRMNSINREATRLIEVRKHKPDQVIVLINDINSMVEMIMDVNNITRDAPLKVVEGKKPVSVYLLLNRLEVFLFKMGAPSTQPHQVLRRAQTISFLADQLCPTDQCSDIRHEPLLHVPPKRPIDVYVEVFGLISAMRDLVLKTGMPIDGGVLVPEVERGLITPKNVNKVLGGVLADFIEISKARGFSGVVEMPIMQATASPREVWQEVNYARRKVLRLAEGQ